MTGDRAIVLAPALRRAIVAHAQRDLPRECCGLLVGRGRTVQFVAPMTNVEASAVRYRIDERAHLDLRRALRAFVPPLSIVGVYHSHPAGSPQPSPSDIAEAFYPDWIYVIVGLSGARPRLGAYSIEGSQVRPFTLVS